METKIPEIKTIKAYRGESLTIDLGKEFSGTLQAWMRRESDSTTYRSFEIIDNKSIRLSKHKASDYINEEGGVIEEISGKWYFDVKQTIDILKPEETRVVFRGIILFTKDILSAPVISTLEYS